MKFTNKELDCIYTALEDKTYALQQTDHIQESTISIYNDILYKVSKLMAENVCKDKTNDLP